MKSAKYKGLWYLFIPFVVLSLLLICTPQAAAQELSITNVTGSQFTVSWISDQPSDGKVKVFRGPIFVSIFDDDRGKDFQGTTHYVTVKGLHENTEYTFSIEPVDSESGVSNTLYQVSTGSNLIPVGSIQPAGQVFYADGVTPASGAIVYITILGRGGTSAPLSTLVDRNGYWHIELINTRVINLIELYQVSAGDDSIIVSVEGGDLGAAYFEGTIVDNQGGSKLYTPLILK